MQDFAALDGALLVDKPAGPTSHDIVDVIRKHFHIRKVGHCGTLDPNATGLLVLLLGRATRLSEQLMSSDKTYSGSIVLGETTNSYDADGEPIATLPVPPLTLDDLNAAAAPFLGDQLQTPPMVSAVKKDGVPLYKLARKGIEVERKARLIHVYRFKFHHYIPPIGCFQIACTKGTYVRSIAHELGQNIGCGAHLATLRRLSSGSHHVQNAIEFERLILLSVDELAARVIPFLQLTN